MGTRTDVMVVPGLGAEAFAPRFRAALEATGHDVTAVERHVGSAERSPPASGRFRFHETWPDARMPAVVIEHDWNASVVAPWPEELAGRLADEVGGFVVALRAWQAAPDPAFALFCMGRSFERLRGSMATPDGPRVEEDAVRRTFHARLSALTEAPVGPQEPPADAIVTSVDYRVPTGTPRERPGPTGCCAGFAYVSLAEVRAAAAAAGLGFENCLFWERPVPGIGTRCVLARGPEPGAAAALAAVGRRLDQPTLVLVFEASAPAVVWRYPVGTRVTGRATDAPALIEAYGQLSVMLDLPAGALVFPRGHGERLAGRSSR